MPITILPPALPPQINYNANSDVDDDMDIDSEGDVDMAADRATYKKPRTSRGHIVTPGELVTDDTQWMRCARRSCIMGEHC